MGRAQSVSRASYAYSQLQHLHGPRPVTQPAKQSADRAPPILLLLLLLLLVVVSDVYKAVVFRKRTPAEVSRCNAQQRAALTRTDKPAAAAATNAPLVAH